MKTDTKLEPVARNGLAAAKSVKVKGRRMVMLEEAEYQRLPQKADEWEPDLPPANERGNYPAVETLDVLLARDILRHRRRLGLSQANLARRAGIRVATLNAIEQAKRCASVRTVDKIDKALTRAEKAAAL